MPCLLPPPPFPLPPLLENDDDLAMMGPVVFRLILRRYNSGEFSTLLFTSASVLINEAESLVGEPGDFAENEAFRFIRGAYSDVLLLLRDLLSTNKLELKN